MMQILCDKCHKNIATTMVKKPWEAESKDDVIYICDECAGIEPVKSVTYSNVNAEPPVWTLISDDEAREIERHAEERGQPQ